MKRYLILLVVALSFQSVTFAQKEEKEGKKANPPQSAKAAFTKAFPSSTNVKWRKEDDNYEAEFKQKGNSMSAAFSPDGTMLESELTIKTSELPPVILQYVKEHYKGASIKEAAKITKANGDVNYEAEVNHIDVMFDANGKFIKEEKD